MAAEKRRKSSSVQMNGILRSSDMKQLRYRVLYALLVLIMLMYVAVVAIPSVWMVLTGFKDVTEMYARPAHFFPKEIHISKLIDVWTQLQFYNYYVNTFTLALGAMVFDVIFNGFAGYVLSRLKPRGSKVVYWLVLLLMMMPSTMSTVPLYKTFMSLGLLETYFPIWIMAGVNMFNIILFKTSFDSISNSLIEAAKIDGATDISIFFKIVLPMSVPIIMTVCIFTFNAQFGNFFWPYLLIGEKEKWTLGIWLYEVKRSSLTVDKQMITVFFAIIPQLIVFIMLNKYIIGGINIGGVKG